MSSNNGVLGFIHDGYSRRGFVSGVARLHPSLRFTYRPMLSQSRALVLKQIADSEDPEKAEEIAAQSVAAQVVDWDLKDHNDKPVDVEINNVLRIEPNLSTKLFQIVIGSRVTDADPEWTDETKAERDERALARALSGAGPQEEEEVD